MRSLLRTCSLLAGGTLVVACGDPDLKTDLDTEGPPEVNMVTVTQEGPPLSVNGGAFFEAPTFCRDTGGKVNREICPEGEMGGRNVEARTDVAPFGWAVRVVFSELLDPDVEELREDMGVTTGHIDATNPVILDCGGGAITIDGHYDPSGNDVSAPPGPSIFAFPQDPFPAATGSSCTLMVDTGVVTDKDNNALPSTEAGPYNFTLAPLHLAASDPAQAFGPDGMTLVEVEGVAAVDEMGAQIPVTISFNAPLDETSIDATDVSLTLGDDTDVPATITIAGDTISVVPTANWLGDTSYKLILRAASDINDATGGGVYSAPAEDFVVLFKTDVLPDTPDAGPAPDAMP